MTDNHTGVAARMWRVVNTAFSPIQSKIQAEDGAAHVRVCLPFSVTLIQKHPPDTPGDVSICEEILNWSG